MFKRLSLIIVVCLICFSAFAGDWTFTTSSGTYNYTLTSVPGSPGKFYVNGDQSVIYDNIGKIRIVNCNVSITLNTTEAIGVKDVIEVTGANGKLTMGFGTGYVGGHNTLIRDCEDDSEEAQKRFFYVHGDNAKLTIQGNSTNYFDISGGCENFTITPNGDSYEASANHKRWYSLVIIEGGTLDFDYVCLTNNWVDITGDATASKSCGGALSLSGKTKSLVYMDNCLIQQCYAKNSGGALYLSSNLSRTPENIANPSQVELNNVEIKQCYTRSNASTTGATIRTQGANLNSLTMTNCHIHDNYSISGGGAATWNAGLVAPLKLTNCTIEDNWSGSEGGALNCGSSLELVGCTIIGNRSNNKGGAISYNTYSSNNWISDFRPYNGTIKIDANTTIANNSSKNGGGIYMNIRPIVIKDPDNTHGGEYTVMFNNNGEPYSVGLDIEGAEIYGNEASSNGGAIYMNRETDIYNTDLNLKFGELYSNKASSGGGIYINGGIPINIGDTDPAHELNIYGNEARDKDGGGLYVANGIVTINGGNIGTSDHPNKSTKRYGGGIYIAKGNITINGGNINYNQSYNHGGGVYIKDGTLDINEGTISNNSTSATNSDGGGFYIEQGDITINGGNIISNQAYRHGGGAYVKNGTLSIVGGTISNNISQNGYGGGFYVGGGNEIHISGADISENHADEGYGGGLYCGNSIIVGYSSAATITGNTAKNGAGFYVNSAETATTTIKNNSIISGNIASGNGGGIYMRKGMLVIDESNIGTNDSKNKAKNGAGVFMNSGVAAINNGLIQYNEASANGGGLYVADNSQIGFTNGTFTNNSASNGGGIYVASGGSLTMTGTSNITGNHTADASGQGGGVYMDGTMNVSGTSLHVWDNHPGNTTKQSNVYLPDHDDFITMTGNLSGTAKVGISVPTVPTPVIYSSDRSILQSQYEAFQAGSSQLVDDRGVFDAIYSEVSPYDLDHIFFLGTWRKYIAKEVTDPSPYADGEAFKDINTPELLATYLCYVNGLPPFTDNHPSATGTVTADLDMNEYLWTSIGTRSVDDTYSTDPFSGTFDGQGHVISNLRSEGLIGYSDYGLFGKVSGGTVKNVFLKDSDIATNEADHVGILAAEAANATILNCEGAGTITVTEEGSTMGGLVGTASGSTKIVNSMAMAEMKGGSTMGGLVGEMASGTLENSFANPKFSEAHGHVGGLVGENAGTVSNCYARLRGDAPSGFGYLAGSNSGTVSLSYCPTGGTAIGSGTAGTGLDTYSPTGAYTYGDLGGNLLSDGTTCLLDRLNANAASATGYATWTRTSGSAINGDYPILKLGYESACSADGIVLQYGSLDQSLARLTSGDVLLYGSASCTRSKPAGVNLYIDEDASLVSSSDALDAYVGVTLKSPEGKWYWHQFSTPLSAAPIGIHYEDATTQYGIWDEPAAISFTSDGYFPEDTDPSDADFYCFYEPQYHWINFKRNSNSHWHQDGYNGQIHYDNESVMPKGKGYLLALGATTFVQSHGILNNGDVSIAVTASGAHLTGYNLLGNPYQSYLDFDEFAEANDGILSSGKYANSYLIFDEAENAYLTYTAGASKGAATASRYIHPHQGFYIQASGSGTAQFTDGMRAAAPAGGSSYRGGGMNYPLVNLFVADEGGKRDVLVIELDRPELSGARKMAELKNGEGSIYARSEGNDYSILFAKGHVTEQPVRFHADSEGEFTLSWDTQNGVFTYLHLIDNLDGTDTDCLACEGYRFSATPGDYESRFRLVMQYEATEYGIGEHDCTAASSFAYISDGELVISNEGRANLQVIDMTGRIIRNQQVEGDCRISTDGMAAGVYVISLNGNVQKIVVK